MHGHTRTTHTHHTNHTQPLRGLACCRKDVFISRILSSNKIYYNVCNKGATYSGVRAEGCSCMFILHLVNQLCY